MHVSSFCKFCKSMQVGGRPPQRRKDDLETGRSRSHSRSRPQEDLVADTVLEDTENENAEIKDAEIEEIEDTELEVTSSDSEDNSMMEALIVALQPTGTRRPTARKSAPPTTRPSPLPPRATAAASSDTSAASATAPPPPPPPHRTAPAALATTSAALVPLRSSPRATAAASAARPPPLLLPPPLSEVLVRDMRPLLQAGEREDGGRAWNRRPELWATGLGGLARELLGLRCPQPPLYSIDNALRHVRDLVSKFGGTSSWLYVGLTSRPPEERWRLPDRHGRAHCDYHLRMLVAVEGPGRAMRVLEREVIAYYFRVSPRQIRNTGPGGEAISDHNPRVALYVCIGRRPTAFARDLSRLLSSHQSTGVLCRRTRFLETADTDPSCAASQLIMRGPFTAWRPSLSSQR